MRLALACFLLLVVACEYGEAPSRQKDRVGASVVLFTLDTTRADRLGCYGHGGGNSPRIDRFAAAATLFTNAMYASWAPALSWA